jgi:hypothetical protein
MDERDEALLGAWSDEERLGIVQSAWHILLRRDRQLMNRVLSILRRWYDKDDLRSDLFLRGWLVVDYARGSRRDCANYVYSVMANRLRDIARALKRRYDCGFSEEDSLDGLEIGVGTVDDCVDWLHERELDVLRLRVSFLEQLLREHAEGAYWDYRMRVDAIVDEVLAAHTLKKEDYFFAGDSSWDEVNEFLETIGDDDETLLEDWGDE